MPKAMHGLLKNGYSRDEPDRIPKNITISNLDIFMYIVAIVGHFVDLGLDINVAVQYFLAKTMVEFWWTLAFILLPAFVNTAVSIRILIVGTPLSPGVGATSNDSVKTNVVVIEHAYSQDKEQDSVTNEVTKRHWLRIFILVLQMAPILRFTDALIYAIKSRHAERKGDPVSQRKYYQLMLKEDSDAALLRIFECFLEAAPQQVLQTSLLLKHYDVFAVHQCLSIASSVIGMGWCLAAYQRAVRYANHDKHNMNWYGTLMQVIWHFLVTLSRVISISTIAYLFPLWTILACSIHILIMASWLQIFDRSPFCSHNKLCELTFSLTLGAVYLFTYVLPTEGRTRYRYAVYYPICFIQNITCAALWYVYTNDLVRGSLYFHPVLLLCILPFIIGIAFMLLYYGFFHPRVKAIADVLHDNNVTVSFKTSGQTAEVLN